MIDNIFDEIRAERRRQDEKRGEQNHQMLDKCVPTQYMEDGASIYKEINSSEKRSWFSIIQEEIYKAFAETEPEKQREEMIQVAAVAVAIIEYLDRRIGNESNT